MKLIQFLFFLFSLQTIGQTIVHQEDFSAGLGSWTAVSLMDATNAWIDGGGYAEINGFGGTDDEDWLISPAINLDAQADEFFLFDYNDGFDGALLELYYSTDYNGGGTAADVSAATWNQLNDRFINISTTSCFSTLFQRHPAIDIGSITGPSTYFAFRYLGTASEAKEYKIDNIRVLADYYAPIPSGLTCCDLKTALFDLVKVQADRLYYTSSNYDVWDAMLHTDVRMNDAGTDTIMWDMFTDIPGGPGEYEFDPCDGRDLGAYSTCSTCYQREHTFPKSWWGGGTTLSDSAYSDMHHLVPADRSLNISKSNQPPGVVLTATTTGANGFKVGTNSGYPCSSINYFEPIDDYKGDYARIYFFMATRYQHAMSSWEAIDSDGDCALNGDPCTGYEPWLVDVLLNWHESDPVSSKEQERNNAVYAIQGNRNPFIDNPDWVQYIWGDASGTPCSSITLPIELISFEASISGDRSVSLVWETASEINNDYFLVERKSPESDNWMIIGKVQGNGNTSTGSVYNYDDTPAALGTYYYRLRQFDFDGENKATQAVSVYLKPTDVEFFPNPVDNIVNIKLRESKAYSLDVLNLYGNTILHQNGSSENVEVNLSGLHSGLYIIRLSVDGYTHVLRITKH